MNNKSFTLINRNNEKLNSQHPTYESVPFGILLAIVGGFLDAYTYIGRGGVFANAQTGNIVFLGIYASKGEWNQALAHLPPIVAFVLGVIVAEAIKNNSPRLFLLHWTPAILLFEMTVLIFIGFITNTAHNSFATVIVSFVSSVQISSFRKLVDSPYCTTMSTGNLRSAFRAAYIAVAQKDLESGIRAIRYFVIIISFVSGAFLGGLLTFEFGVRAIWGAAVILALTVVLYWVGERRRLRKARL
ncbi:YoaK family protein [Ruminiclostridium papyrosolvens]|uniref:Membrane protein n=1 Tax=Ruminiclostridium papyrosolvens C7 TaxID=1330534 RepID=U4R4Z2_9FIRM|nr:YoaK family protein [Ruminiclostridium papyrosolvens]EPR13463.1 membrane protein [Ruminiclostridium papyrosolvens C7]